MSIKTKKSIRLLVIFLISLLFGFIILSIFRTFQTSINVDYSLQRDVCLYLEKHNISSSRIKQCPNYMDFLKKFTVSKTRLEVAVTDSEVKEYVERIMKSYEKLVNIKGRKTVKNGDFVTVRFSVYYKGKVVSAEKNATFKVGAGYYDKQFETILIGMKKGNIYKRQLVVPDDYEDKKMVGKEEVFKIEILAIQKYITYDLDDDFVKNNLGANSVQEYYEYAEKKVLEEKKSKLCNNIMEEILNNIISLCKFKINQEEVANFAIGNVENQEKLAEISGMTLEEFIKENNMDETAFYEKCYAEAEKTIKQALVIGALAAQMDIILSDTDLEDVDARYAVIKQNVMSKFGLY